MSKQESLLDVTLLRRRGATSYAFVQNLLDGLHSFLARAEDRRCDPFATTLRPHLALSSGDLPTV